MFRQLDDFMKAWEYEERATANVLNHLTDESLHQEVAEGNWSLGRIAWHIVTSVKNLSSQVELDFEAPSEDWIVPTSAKDIAEGFVNASKAFKEALQTQVTDEMLLEEIDFFGRNMTKGVLLSYLINHQTHHRGQMTILMRQAELEVPGIYGPSKNEWAKYGMVAPK
ncbi:DinB family protein [Bacillus solimangrovi]|uniref:Damage-inducible protein DinB n=1 Tax=Bacillus solimangrovi TaxID=1305675 RepID=A0A1E5LJ98_9BACI|nr:DinB family protein [Bacillus solimangrovi]OEH94160.1 hypothetical protein BFG57_08895 [Bacillus solimangrovi]